MTDAFRDQVDRIKAAIDGPMVAGRLGLQGRGRRFFCPACQSAGGKSPDLSVTDQGFTCFKCGESGDLVRLVELVNGVDFKAAVAWLATEAGMEAPGMRQDGRQGRTRGKGSDPSPIVRPGRSGAVTEARIGGPVPDIFDAFLAGCRPVDGLALAYLTGRGIDPAVIDGIGLRFCGREYADLTKDLEDRFSRDALLSAGLLTNGRKGPYPTFWPIVAKKVGFLVIPYRQNGRPVYLKARPPIDKTTAEAKGVVRFLNSGRAVPCLFNVDAIADADQVLICEGETDTMTALSHGYAAAGIPGWSAFKAEWVGLFGGKSVFLVLDADAAGNQGVRDIALKFDRAGQPLPRQVILPAGQDLNDFFRDGSKEGWKDGKPEGWNE